MKVRIKEGQKCFIYGSLRREESEVTLKAFDHPSKLDDNGEPLVVTAQDQFSRSCMVKVEEPKAKPGPKPKIVKEKSE